MIPNVRDLSGQGNHGNLSGQVSTTTVPGVTGQAISLDGVNDQVQMTSDVFSGGLTALTVSYWVNVPTFAQNGFVTTVLGSNSGSYGNGFGITNSYQGQTSTFSSAIKISSNVNAVATVQGSYSPNTWYHVVSVFDGSQSGNSARLKNYVNAQLKTSVYDNTVPASVLAEGSITSIAGPNNLNSLTYFKGKVDDLRVYNRALSATEVMQLYNLGGTKITTPTDPLKNGLVGWWTLDGKDMITNARDSSGNGYNGFLSSAFTSTSSAIYAGKIGQGFKSVYGLSNSRIDVSAVSSAMATGDVSVSVWIKPTSAAQSSMIFHLGDSPSTNDIIIKLGQAGYSCGSGINFDVYFTGHTCASSGVDPIVGKWYHVVGVFSSVNGQTLYINGSSAATNPNTSRGTTASVLAAIGADPAGTAFDKGFDGVIDDVRVYNRALSASEVRRLYGQGNAYAAVTPADPLKSGLVAWWTFDGKDTNWNTNTSKDLSGNGYTADISNMSTTTSPTPGKIGQSLKFQDPQKVLTSFTPGTVLGVTGSYTISFWTKQQSPSGTIEMVYSAQDAGATRFYMNVPDSSFSTTMKLGMSSWNPVENNTVKYGVWQFWTAVLDGTNGRIYLNGSLIDSTTGITVSNPTTASIQLGRGVSSSNQFVGQIDDFRIYNRALSGTEILMLYNQGR
jgi:hypothetical protein